jgi:hypothetical protein
MILCPHNNGELSTSARRASDSILTDLLHITRSTFHNQSSITPAYTSVRRIHPSPPASPDRGIALAMIGSLNEARLPAHGAGLRLRPVTALDRS